MRKRSKENLKSLTPLSSSIWINPRRPWTDICFALAGTERIVSNYARLKYAGEDRYYGDVWRYIFYKIKKISKENKWEYPNEHFLVRLAELAVQESIRSDMCTRCNGKGYVATGYTRIDCFSCDGSGKLKRTERYRFRFMNTPERTWYRHWRVRFRREVLGIVDVFEGEIDRALHRRL